MKRIIKYYWNLFFVVFTLATTTTMANVKLPYVLSSNMVLQRGLESSIWGWAEPGEQIIVDFRGVSIKTKTNKDGKWIVKVTTGEAGGPFVLTIKGKNNITLENILVGDVWVCSGQSNMEWSLDKSENGAVDVSKAKFPQIRLFTVNKQTAKLPVENTLPATWEVCSPETARQFSAVGYFFGRKIHTEIGVPIGLISSSWGGTNVETWTSEEAAITDSIMAAGVKNLKLVETKELAQKQAVIFETYHKVWKEVQKSGFTHEYLSNSFDDSNWNKMIQPQLWENVAGWDGFDGIVWYRKSIEIPASFNLNSANLSLSSIDDSDIAWINGIRVGETYNKYNEPRNYKIGNGVLKSGVNQLVLRIEDYSGGGGIYGAAAEMFLTDGITSVDLAGEWKVMKDETPTPQNPLTLVASSFQPNQFPTLLFNGMISPILKFAIKGAIWYQGESNADAMPQALRYEKQLRMMIADWRKQWAVGKFPFYMVQLANFKPETQQPETQIWPFLREAQANLANEDKVGMACIIDIGNPNNIHPRNKVDVGERLALNSLKFDYGKEVIYCGPRKSEVAIDGDKAFVTFNFTGNGLKMTNKYGYINGFAVADDDRVFHYAKARKVSSNRVEVTCDLVKNIKAVRFLWDDNPGEINFFNSVGLPAEPFRTDRW